VAGRFTRSIEARVASRAASASCSARSDAASEAEPGAGAVTVMGPTSYARPKRAAIASWTAPSVAGSRTAGFRSGEATPASVPSW
jgi:hypothetical protein